MRTRTPFNHLTFTDRLRIEAMQKAKTPIKIIAATLGVHISTVYRELKRGVYIHKEYITCDCVGEKQYKQVERYSPDIANEKYRQNLSAKGAPLKIANDYALADYIETRIVDENLSPSAVLGEIKKKALPFATRICTNTLYSYIDKGVFLRLSLKNLPLKEKRKKSYRKVNAAKPPRGESIEKRPNEIAERNSFGHWEMDCVCGKTKDTLLVFTERLTRKEIIMPIPNQCAESVVKALDMLEKRFGKLFYKVFKSITVDNGTEFSDCKGMESSRYKNKQRTKFYYCHPYSSYERGTNERMNREIRRQLPKGTDFSLISPAKIKQVETWINTYPRQVLGYATSDELFTQQLARLT